MQKNKNIKGFTLIELAIVLIVIALLIGGVLAGQDVLTATKRNSIITEVNNFRASISQFKAKYFNNIPGDFDEAETYWTSSVTSDGDGDGRIDKDQDTPGESLLVWEHLSLAEMLSGGYTGEMSSSDTMIQGENIPGSEFSKDTGYNMFHSNSNLADMLSSHALYNRNVIMAGGCSAQTADSVEFCSGGIAIPADAYAIDKKMDDGVSYTGKVVSYNEFTGSDICSSGLDEAGVDYDLDGTALGCMILFGFNDLN